MWRVWELLTKTKSPSLCRSYTPPGRHLVFQKKVQPLSGDFTWYVFCTKTLKLHWKIVKIFLGGFAPQTFTNFIDSILQVINQMWHNITRLFWKVCLSCSPRKRRLAIDFECNAPNIPCGVQRLRLIKEQIDVIFRSKLLQMKIQSIHSYSDVSVSKDNVRYWWGHKFLLLYSFTICFLMSLLFTRVIPNIFDLFKNFKANSPVILSK